MSSENTCLHLAGMCPQKSYIGTQTTLKYIAVPARQCLSDHVLYAVFQKPGLIFFYSIDTAHLSTKVIFSSRCLIQVDILSQPHYTPPQYVCNSKKIKTDVRQKALIGLQAQLLNILCCHQKILRHLVMQ